MSKKIAHHLLVVCLGVLSLAVLAQAQTTNPAPKCEQIKFTLVPGGSQTFTLPDTLHAMRIEISTPSTNNGVQTPSELMWALVNWDNGSEGSHQITWIGTNSDGSTSGSNSLQNTTIANIYGGKAPTVVASLTVSNASTGTLEVSQSGTTTTINGSYIVRIYY
jgi:hypothetical protein